MSTFFLFFLKIQLFFCFQRYFTGCLWFQNEAALPRLFKSPQIIVPTVADRVSAQRLGFVPAFSRCFFPNAPPKISDTGVSGHMVIPEIA